MMKTVQIFLRDGMNPEAFAVAFQKVMAENPDITPNSIQSIEKKGRDILLTLKVPAEIDRGKIEQQFDEVYLARLEAQKMQHYWRLSNVTTEISKNLLSHKQRILTSARFYPTSHLFSGDRNVMTDNKNQGIAAGDGTFVNTGTQNLSNSLVNLSGTVTNSLNQLQPPITQTPRNWQTSSTNSKPLSKLTQT